MNYQNMAIVQSVFAALFASTVLGQCPTLNYTTIELPCRYDLGCANIVNVSGAAPLTYSWQYYNGSGWTNFPATSGNITINSNVVGVGYAGNSASCHVTATFVIGLALKFDTRCNISNGCGQLVVTNTSGVKYCLADYYCTGIVNSDDYDAFMDDYYNSDPDSDFNQDTVLDYFDYLDFVDAYSAGCP